MADAPVSSSAAPAVTPTANTGTKTGTAPASSAATPSKNPATKTGTPAAAQTPSRTGAGAAMAARKESPIADDPASDAAPSPDTDTEAAAAAEQKAIEKLKIKYRANKQDVEEELTHEEIALRLSQAAGMRTAFQERDSLKQAASELFETLKGRESVWEVLKELGHDPDELAYARVAERYQRAQEDAQLTEDQKAARAAKEEAERYKKQLEAIEAKKREAAETRMRQEVENRTKATLEGALQELGVDATPESLYEAAYVMKQNLQYAQSMRDPSLRLTPQQVAQEVRRRMDSRNERFHKSAAERLKGEALVKYLGGMESPVIAELVRYLGESDSPAVKALIKARLEKMKRAAPFEPPAPKPAPAAEDDAEKKPFDRTAWRRENIYGAKLR